MREKEFNSDTLLRLQRDPAVYKRTAPFVDQREVAHASL